jgi:hypothetical protein
VTTAMWHLASRLVPRLPRGGGATAPAQRALSSMRGGGGGRAKTPAQEKIERLEAEAEAAIWEKLNQGPEPRFRLPPPVPPTTHRESWAPAAHVSADPTNNALNFETRFYIDAAGEQPDHARKVHVNVDISKLSLNALERKRLLAVAWTNYDRKRKVLRFSCDRYAEVARNKAELRRKVALLVEDARENAEGHASIPDAELPLAARERPWFPRDPRVYKGYPKNRFKGAKG